jgi:microcystin-dependent protein
MKRTTKTLYPSLTLKPIKMKLKTKIIALFVICALSTINTKAQSEPFLGQITMFAGNFAPRGWAKCEGQLLQISQYSALFSILGTMYGGDGRTTFALPDLRGRTPIGVGTGPGLTPRREGQRSGSETNTMTVQQMPSHNHTNVTATILLGASSGVRDTPIAGDVPSAASFSSGLSSTKVNAYGPATDTINGQAIPPTQNTGGQQAQNNMQPYLTINYIIALQGIYPSRS